MNYHEIVKNGYVLRIEDNREASTTGFYDPAEFWMEGGNLLAWCPEVGIFQSTLSAEEFNDNAATFLAEGLDIIIKHTKNFTR